MVSLRDLENAIRDKAIPKVNEEFDRLKFSSALEAVWQIIANVDGVITASAPWKLAGKDDPDSRSALADILYTAAESVRIVTALVYPVLPISAAQIWRQLGLGDIAHFDLKSLAWGQLKPGTKLGELSAVFPRAEKDMIQRMEDLEQKNAADAADSKAKEETNADAPKTKAPQPPALESNQGSQPTAAEVAGKEAVHIDPLVVNPAVGKTESAPLAPPAAGKASAASAAAGSIDTNTKITIDTNTKITIDDFAKVELRVAEIKVAERIPKADKLLRLEVDLGYEKRQILAGIAEAYTPESLIGRKVVIVANLAPRKLRGLESNGMIVAASLGENGAPVLAGFLEEVEIGARLK